MAGSSKLEASSLLAEASVQCLQWYLMKKVFIFFFMDNGVLHGMGRRSKLWFTIALAFALIARHSPTLMSVPSSCHIAFSMARRDLFNSATTLCGSFWQSSIVQRTLWLKWGGRIDGWLKASWEVDLLPTWDTELLGVTDSLWVSDMMWGGNLWKFHVLERAQETRMHWRPVRRTWSSPCNCSTSFSNPEFLPWHSHLYSWAFSTCLQPPSSYWTFQGPRGSSAGRRAASFQHGGVLQEGEGPSLVEVKEKGIKESWG